MRTTLIFLSLLFIMIGCSTGGEQEVLVVPKNFKGYVLVIFNQKNGQPIRYMGKKRVYEIPANGILKTQFKVNNGWRDLTEYYVDEISHENMLPSFVEAEKIPKDKTVGFMGETGTVKKNSKSTERVEFSEFYIGTRSDIEKAKNLVEKLDIANL